MDEAPTALNTPFGTFELKRYPTRRRESLQAWCAADILLLEEVHRLSVPGADTLVVNDDFGALCLALSPRGLWTDSSLAVTALRRNESANGAGATAVIWATEAPPDGPALVVLRVPKSLSLFHYQLATLAATQAPGTRVIAGGMDKHLSAHTAAAMETWLGPTTRHPGKRKARIFSATLSQKAPTPDALAAHDRAYRSDVLAADLVSRPGVFSGAAPDIGTRLLLSYLPDLTPADTVVDLACGNGVLGLAAFHLGLARQVLFCDESSLAIASARDNAARLFPDARERLRFLHGDGLRPARELRADLILCNPPFHQGHLVDEYTGRRLLAQCPDRLAPGGRLCLVANRHLRYRPLLSKRFREVSRLADNDKFTVYLASSPR